MVRIFTQILNFARLSNVNYRISCKFKCTYKPAKKTYSALYIPGSRASETFSYFSPYLDFDSRFENITETEDELALRGLNINVADLRNAWNLYKTLVSTKLRLESNEQSLRQQLKNLKSTDSSRNIQNKIEAIQSELKVNKKDQKTLTETIWEMEEDIIIRCLRLPTKLHTKTPRDSPKIIESFGEKSVHATTLSHIELGTRLDLLEYRNKFHYFLFNEAALFELGVLNFVGQMLKSKNFIQVAGLDFARASIVEGSGAEHNDHLSAFLLKNINDEKNTLNPLHLVGNSSLISFLALFTKMKFNPKDLPLCYFSAGRQYTPKLDVNSTDGLFDVCQESIVQIFIVSKNKTEFESLFNQVLNSTMELYKEIFNNCNIVIRSASELKSSESLRASFEIWSNYKQEYVEVGHIAMHSDYFSKRLLICYQTSSGRDFPNIISGTLISIPKMLACLLENTNESQIFEKLKKYAKVKDNISL